MVLEESKAWRDVPGYEGIYEVSYLGEVRSYKDVSNSKHKNWEQVTLEEKIDLKNRTCSVHLYKDGELKSHYIHRLVASAFLPNPLLKEEVNHIDGNRLNNELSNLEWTTKKENVNHAMDNNLGTTNHPIILKRKDDGREYYFRSKQKASEFLGKQKNYISSKLRGGKKETKEYFILSPKSHQNPKLSDRPFNISWFYIIGQ